MTRRGPNVLRLLTTLVLLLATSASAKDVTDPSPAIPGRQPLGASSEPYFSTEDDPSRRREIGTKDAPVDGLDGKPHAGPFVDAKAALRDIQDTADRIRPPGGKTSDYRDKATAEDGVMNDPNRKAPKQGTTGTEGGVSEKDRDRRIQEFSTGERVAKIPDPPKSSMGDDAATTTKSASSGATGIDRERRENEKDKGFVGLEVWGSRTVRMCCLLTFVILETWQSSREVLQHRCAGRRWQWRSHHHRETRLFAEHRKAQ